MREPVIIFDRLSKHYFLYHHLTSGIKNFFCNFRQSINSFRNSRFEALHDISFEIYKGEAFGIIGRNGAGKSTLLGLIAGVLRPSSGSVTVRGKVSPLLELGAGFHPELTGRENILLNGVLMGLTRAKVLKSIDEIIEFSELGDFIEQPIRVYSSGMLSRLGFSVVAHLDPEILLIDETLAVGDMRFQKKCVDRIMDFKNSDTTIVFVSHDISTVEQICDRSLWIDDCGIKMMGDVKAVVAEYTNDCRTRPSQNPQTHEINTYSYVPGK